MQIKAKGPGTRADIVITLSEEYPMNGWNEANSTTDHGQLKKYVAKMTPAQLQHVALDARQARDAMPDGHKAGYYSDLICAIADRKHAE